MPAYVGITAVIIGIAVTVAIGLIAVKIVEAIGGGSIVRGVVRIWVFGMGAGVAFAIIMAFLAVGVQRQEAARRDQCRAAVAASQPNKHGRAIELSACENYR